MSESADPAGGRVLCALGDIPEYGARGFAFGSGTDYFRLFVVRRGDAVHGFENSCPHEGTPLDTFPDHFFTSDRRRLLCSTHGAQFRPEDGVCVFGPCKGKALRGVSVANVGRRIVLGR